MKFTDYENTGVGNNIKKIVAATPKRSLHYPWEKAKEAENSSIIRAAKRSNPMVMKKKNERVEDKSRG